MNKELTATQYGQRAIIELLFNKLAFNAWRLIEVRIVANGITYRAAKYRTSKFVFNHLMDSGEICIRFERGSASAWLKLMDNEDPIHDYSTTPNFCKIVERFKLT